MKFGQQLELNTFPQWSHYYVRYRQIKNHINALFPTPSEIEKAAVKDHDKATLSLLQLTDPERARQLAAAAATPKPNAALAAPKKNGSVSPSPSPTPSVESDEQEGVPLLRSASPAVSSGAVAPLLLAQRNETLAFNVNTKSYGGFETHNEHEHEVSSDDDHDSHPSPPHSAGLDVPAGAVTITAAKASAKGMNVQLEHVSLGLRDDGFSNASTASNTPVRSQNHSPARGALPPLPPSASAALANGLVSSAASAAASSARPALGRRVSAVTATGDLVVSKRRFHPLAPSSHLEKMDQVVVKLMGELQKIDEFHKLMEGKIAAAFEGLKAQVAAAREGDTVDTAAIHRKIKEMKQAKQMAQMHRTSSSSQSGGGMGSKTLPTSKSANSLSTAVAAGGGGEEKELQSGRASPRLDSDNDGSGHPHVLGHTRFHARAGNGRSHSAAWKEKVEREQRSQGHHSRHDSGGSEEPQGLDSIPLKAAFSQLLRRATMLIHFVDINYVAVAKLLKCFEKRAMAALRASAEGRDPSRSPTLSQALKVHKQLPVLLQNRKFYTSRKVDTIIVPEIYKLYGDLFEGGNVERAKIVLLANLTEQQYSRHDAFWLGLKLGCIAMLLSFLLVIMVRPGGDDLTLVHEMQLFAPIYRCVGLLVALLWLWSFLVQVWDNFGIPYVLMFQLNPRTRLTHFQLKVEAANITIVYLLNSLLFLTHAGQAIFGKFSLAIYPAALFLFVFVKLFAPWRRISHWNSRVTLLSVLAQIAMAPFGKVRFLDSFVADFLTSMVKIFVDVEASVCIIATYFVLERTAVMLDCAHVATYVVPILCALPLWWRFLQCLRRYYDTSSRFPHVYNALKYLITHSVVIMAAYHPAFSDHHQTSWQTYRYVWLACLIISTLYSTYWDLVNDWGLFAPNTEWPLLRKELLYGEKYVGYYYFAIVSNCILRWIWVITIVPFSFEETRGNDNYVRISHTEGRGQPRPDQL